jgi:hemerythrin-like domain-containing protein
MRVSFGDGPDQHPLRIQAARRVAILYTRRPHHKGEPVEVKGSPSCERSPLHRRRVRVLPVPNETNEPSDFFACLVQDHARIEARLKALEQAAGVVGRTESDGAALAVIVETLDFFATEGARHEANEELTLFPRLRSLPEFKQILSALHFQHEMNASEEKQLSACVDRFVSGSEQELRRLAHRFAEMHRGHAVAEERALFPLAASRLSPQVVAEMSREMRERTSVVGPTSKPR